MATERYLELLQKYNGIATIAIPLFPVLLSGAYFFGFLSIIGFEHTGSISLSDISKSALRWSPTIALLFAGFAASTLIRTRTDRALDEIKAKLRNPLAEDDILKAREKFQEIEDRRRRITRPIPIISNGWFLSLVILVIIFGSAAGFLFLPIKYSIVFIAITPILSVVPLAYFLVVSNQTEKSAYLFPGIISLSILLNTISAGISAASTFINPLRDHMYIVSIGDMKNEYISYIRFDYSTWVMDQSGSLTIFSSESIDYVKTSNVCKTSLYECIKIRSDLDTDRLEN